jgi:hypothetical protein
LLLLPLLLLVDFNAPTWRGLKQTMSILVPLLLYRTFPCWVTKRFLLHTVGDPDAEPRLMEWTADVNKYV